MRASVCCGPMGFSLNFSGRSSPSFSSRPGSSSPPVQYSQPAGSTPYSSCRMPRIHTGAVIWYSGTPILRPASSFGSRMPLFAETKMHECRKKRDGNTGMAIKAGSSRMSETQ